MTGEMKFNIDTRELRANNRQKKCRCAVCLWHWYIEEYLIDCLPFILLSTIKSINCHNKPLLGCIRVLANCLGMYNSPSPKGSRHRQ